MAMAYITFAGTNAGLVKAFFPTQALANAAATDDAEVAAHVGILDVGELQPRHAYFTGTAVISDSDADALDAILSDTEKLQLAFRTHHDWLRTQSEAGHVEGQVHDIAERHAFHNFMAFAHHAAYTVANDGDLTMAQKITWAENQTLGPTDAETAFNWYVAIRALPTVAGPTSACLWVIPSSGARRSVSQIANAGISYFESGGTIVDESTLADGGWIESLTA